MNARTDRARVSLRLLMVLLVAGGVFAVTTHPASSEEAQSAPAVSGGDAGMVIYVDPKTGALLKEPAPGSVPLQLTPQQRNAISTSHQGLVETPSSVPGGGVKLDLQGRFQSPLFVTIDADGNVKMQHLHEPPESSDKK